MAGASAEDDAPATALSSLVLPRPPTSSIAIWGPNKLVPLVNRQPAQSIRLIGASSRSAARWHCPPGFRITTGTECYFDNIRGRRVPGGTAGGWTGGGEGEEEEDATATPVRRRCDASAKPPVQILRIYRPVTSTTEYCRPQSSHQLKCNLNAT